MSRRPSLSSVARPTLHIIPPVSAEISLSSPSPSSPRGRVPAAAPESDSDDSDDARPAPSLSRAQALPSAGNKQSIRETHRLVQLLLDRLSARSPPASSALLSVAVSREEEQVLQVDKEAAKAREVTAGLVEQLRDLLVLSRDGLDLTMPSDDSSSHSKACLLPNLLSILSSLLHHEALHPTPDPRPSRPPRALQSQIIDIFVWLLGRARQSGDQRAELAVGRSAMAIWAGIERAEAGLWEERVLRFWEDLVRGGMAEELKRNMEGLPGARPVHRSGDAPAIQVSTSDSDSLDSRHGWKGHNSPVSPSSPRPPPAPPSTSSYDALSSPSPTLALLPSILSSLLHAFPLPLSSTLPLFLFRYHRLLDLLLRASPTPSLDLISVLAHGSASAQSSALAILETIDPRATGHGVLGVPPPVVRYESDLWALEMSRQPGREPPERRHLFRPWVEVEMMPEGVVCRSCKGNVEGFHLRCTLCSEASHHACYRPPGSTLIIRYRAPSIAPSASPSNASLRTSIVSFSLVPPSVRNPPPSTLYPASRPVIMRGEHRYALANLFALALCSTCSLPLWGCTSQAYVCTGPCAALLHTACALSGQTASPRCRAPGQGEDLSARFRIKQAKLASSWKTEFGAWEQEVQERLERGDLGFEEAAVLWDRARIQRELVDRGLEGGGFVLETEPEEVALAQPNLGARIEKRLLDALESGTLAISPELNHLLRLIRSGPPGSPTPSGITLALQFLYSPALLPAIVSSLQCASSAYSATEATLHAPSALLVPSHDQSSSSSKGTRLSTILGGLGTTFNIRSPLAQNLYLEHLYSLGSFSIDGSASPTALPLPFLDNASSPQLLASVSFAFPSPIDSSPTQVDLTIRAIERCLASLDIAVNEFALGVLVRKCWPSGASHAWAIERLGTSVLRWNLEEEDRLVVIARDFVSRKKAVPGLASPSMPSTTSSASSRPVVGPNRPVALGAGDYKSARSILIDKFVRGWLHALHECNKELYARVVYSTCSSIWSTGTTSAQGLLSPSDTEDQTLRRIIRLANSRLLFCSTFATALTVWMDGISASSLIEPPVGYAALPRLFNRTQASKRMSTLLMGADTGLDLPTTEEADPWEVLHQVLAGPNDGWRRGLRWVKIMAQSGVAIPSRIFVELDNSISRGESFALDAELAEAAFAACWHDAVGKQDLAGLLSSLYTRSSSKLEAMLSSEARSKLALDFVCKVLGALLLLHGCPRERIVQDGFVDGRGIYDIEKLVAIRSAARFSVISRPLEVQEDVLAKLCAMAKSSRSAAQVVARFLLSLFSHSSLVSELEHLIQRRAKSLLALIWDFFETDSGLRTARVLLLLKILDVAPTAWKELDRERFETDRSEADSCLDVETLYKKIVQLHELDALDELPSPALAADVFRSFLKTLWTSPHEQVRAKTATLCASLFSSYFDLASKSFESYLDTAGAEEKLSLLTFLRELHPFFPSWQTLSWSAIVDVLFEAQFELDRANRGGGYRHSAFYDLGDDDVDDGRDIVSAVQSRLHVLDLALHLIGAGVPVDVSSLLKIKMHVASLCGFEHSELVPSASGRSFSLLFSNLSSLGEGAIVCASGLKSVFDASHRLDLHPSAMGIDGAENEPASSHLVGSAFVDIAISFFNSRLDLGALPYLAQRMWLEILRIIVYKHDFNTDALAHLEPLLLEALKTVADTALRPISTDSRKIIVTTCLIFLDHFPDEVVARIVGRLIGSMARLLSELGLDSTTALAQHARAFVQAACIRFGSSGVYLLLFKDPLEPSFDIASVLLRALPDGEARQVYSHVAKSLFQVNPPRKAFSAILSTLARFAELGCHSKLPAAVIDDISSFISRCSRHTSEFTAADFDPNPLLNFCLTISTNNKSHALTILGPLATFLRHSLSRFDVSLSTLSRISNFSKLAVIADSPQSSLLLSVVLDATDLGLRRAENITSFTLSSLVDHLMDPASLSGNSVLYGLAAPALFFLNSRAPSNLSQDKSAYLANVAVARLVLVVDSLQAGSVLHGWLSQQLSQPEVLNPNHVRTFNWLALAAISLPPSQRPGPVSHLLDLIPFAASACAWTLDATLSAKNRSGADAEHVSSAFAFAKVYLLLARWRSALESVVAVAGNVEEAEAKEMELWLGVWPSWYDLCERASGPSSINSPIATVVQSVFLDLVLFLGSSSPILRSYGPSVEAVILRLAPSTESGGEGQGLKRLGGTLQAAKALSVVRDAGVAGADQLGFDEDDWESESQVVAEDMKAAERLRAMASG